MKVCLACDARFTAADWLCPRCNYSPQIHDVGPVFAPALSEEGDGFKPESFANLAQFEPRCFWFRSRNGLVTWALRRYFPRAASFLEIGCGTGFVLSGIREAVPDLKLAGSEVFKNGLAFAHERLPDVALSQMDARRIPFDAEFDVLGAFDVLEHIEEDEIVLKQMYQAVKPGGGILLTVPQHRFLWSAVDEYAMHKRRYSRSELVRKTEQAGFKITHLTSFVFFLMPLMLLSRLQRRDASAEFDPNAEFQMLRFDPLLGKVMQFEELLIRRGVSLPAGGSLLLVGAKPV